MISPFALVSPSASHSEAAYVVDLIGDVDVGLSGTLADAIRRLGPHREQRVVVRLKHVVAAQAAGLAALSRTLSSLRKAGCDVRVAADSSRVRALLRAAGVRAEAWAGSATALRHVMIVHNATPQRAIA